MTGKEGGFFLSFSSCFSISAVRRPVLSIEASHLQQPQGSAQAPPGHA